LAEVVKCPQERNRRVAIHRQRFLVRPLAVAEAEKDKVLSVRSDAEHAVPIAVFLIEFLKSILSGHNQLASGGLLLMIIGGLGVYMRAVPERLWEWCVCQTTMLITVKDDDAAFVWVKEWFLEQAFVKRVRRVDLDTTLRGETLALVPAPGRHWFCHAGRPFTVEFYRSQDAKGQWPKRSESFTFRTIGRSQEFLRRFVDEVVECHEKSARLQSSLFVFDEYWTRVLGYVPRLLESVILKPGEKEHLIQDVENFKASKKRYSELGVPYHRGYLRVRASRDGKDFFGLGACSQVRDVHLCNQS
jgi:mitochondrial chaperone BCS1